MTYEEFKKELVNALSKKFGDGSVSIANALFMGKETEIIKITIGNRESMCSAKPLFNLHKRDKQPLSYYVSMLESALKEVETPPLLQPSRILYKLVNQKEDAEFLSRAPYLPFYDMAITFLYQLDENMQSRRYLAITNDIMEENNLTVSKLVDLAHENTQRMYPCQTTFLPAQIFENMYFDPSASAEKFIAFALTAFEERSHHSVPMYVVSSYDYRYGCSALAYPEYLDMLAQKFGTSLIVVPDSDKSFFVMPYDESVDKNEIKEGLNKDVLSGCKRISEHIFFFNRDKQTLTIFGEDE